jgi:hypothetical protein
MVAAGLAPTPAVLFVGLLVAGASAGLVFPPFADVVARSLQVEKRPRVLAAISSGTGWGVAVAAPVAIAVGTSWRTAWLLFAALAGVATVWALLGLVGVASVGGTVAGDAVRRFGGAAVFVCALVAEAGALALPIAGQRRGGRRVGDPVRRGLQRRGGRGGDLERARLREPSFRGPGGDPVRAGGGRPDRSSGAGRGGRRGRLRRRILR